MLTIFGFDSKIHKCVYCDNAKRFCSQKGIPYKFVNVMPEKDILDEDVIKEILNKLGRESRVGLTMPQIFKDDGTYIGGFNELRKLKFNV